MGQWLTIVVQLWPSGLLFFFQLGFQLLSTAIKLLNHGTESKHSLCLLVKLNKQVINSTCIHSSTNQYRTETVHIKGDERLMCQSMIKSRKLFFLFLKSTKINRRENVPKDKTAKINSRKKVVLQYTCRTEFYGNLLLSIFFLGREYATEL